jgi:hypothetical protein
MAALDGAEESPHHWSRQKAMQEELFKVMKLLFVGEKGLLVLMRRKTIPDEN